MTERPECILNHGNALGTDGVQRCGNTATHLVRYPKWKNPLPACQPLANRARSNGAEVVSFDALDFDAQEASR